MDETFLYLTTTGRKTGHPHTIEIWYVERDGRYYMISEARDKADWVRNILSNSTVTFSIGTRAEHEAVLTTVSATGRALHPAADSALVAAVRALMDAKYQWSDGLIVELAAHNADANRG